MRESDDETETVWRNLRVPRKWSLDHRCLWTGHSIPPFFIFSPFPWLRNMSTDDTVFNQSTDAIRKRYLYINISRLMQSENGILLLFYIFLSHGKENKSEKRRVGCKKGGCCVLSTSTCALDTSL